MCDRPSVVRERQDGIAKSEGILPREMSDAAFSNARDIRSRLLHANVLALNPARGNSG